MNIKQTLFRRAYHLGFLSEPMKDIVYCNKKYSNVKWVDLNGHKDSWFADPFILNTDGENIDVLAEEFEYSRKKGRISHLVICKKGLKLLSITPILDTDTHLSFPGYIKKNNKIYVYPENYASGAIKIYEYDLTQQKLINPHVLLKEELVDTQLLELNGAFYMLGVKHENDGFKYDYTRELFIYRSQDLFGKYQFFQKIANKRREERGAGHFFYVGNKLIRPAQSCEGGYGTGIVFYEFFQDEKGMFAEKAVGRMSPGWNKYPFVLHTYNILNDYQIIDGMGFDNLITRPFLTLLLQLRHLCRR